MVDLEFNFLQLSWFCRNSGVWLKRVASLSRRIHRESVELLRGGHGLNEVVAVGIGVFALVMTYSSGLYVWATRFQTTAATDIAISWIYAAMPVGFFLLFIHLLFIARSYVNDGSFKESAEMDADAAASL